MKTYLIIALIFFSFFTISLDITAQDYTTWGLPEGATKRLGKGSVHEVAYSPDGSLLAVASSIGIWLYDAESGEEVSLLRGHTEPVYSVSFSPDGQTLASGSRDDGTMLLWNLAPADTTPTDVPSTGPPAWDVNEDGQTTLIDLLLVIADYKKTPIVNPRADVNGDGTVDKRDILIVASHLDESTDAAAPASFTIPEGFTATTLQEVLNLLRTHDDGSFAFQRGITYLERLLASVIPEKTALLPNYPNPFNPETWIPYQLAAPADVTLRIYAVDGTLVRTLSLGHQPAGIYQSRSRAAYWDGRNAHGERVASGIYFYQLMTPSFQQTRRLVILK